MAKKKTGPMGVTKWDVRKSKAAREGHVVFPENPLSKSQKATNKWIAEQYEKSKKRGKGKTPRWGVGHGEDVIPSKQSKPKKLAEAISVKKGGTVSRKKGGNIMKGRKAGGTVKKQVGGLPQGYNARLDESLAARHPAVRGNLAARRAESMGMERALGRGPYSGARTMVKKGGSVRRKKGSTVSRRGGGKIMQGYKAGGKV